MSYKKIYIQINNIKNLKQIRDFLNGGEIHFDTKLEKEVFNKSIKLLEEAFGGISEVDGYLIGNEFCEHLYFKLDLLDELLNVIGSKELIINTSILTIYNQKYYKLLFSFLKEKNQKFKLVINDIGFIKMVNEFGFKDLQIIIGRLILKHKKIFNKKNKTKNLFNDQSINLGLFADFFKKYDIKSYTVDILPQGSHIIDDYKDKFLYFPWGYYASSRGCITKSTFSEKNYVFPLKSCDRPCTGTYMEFDHMEYLIGKGNSVFYKSIDFVDIDDFKKYENYIFQPFFPM